ncbi:hypothetical protein B2G71_10280 [Novosphingobium sp. PC22D]|nr:hypothetical protein B2G71_10280 [Novosphingobium sp. PC22D]
MKRKAIGFYWTLPVPWAGFTKVDTKDAAKAAGQSRTIAMQRKAVHGFAKSEGYQLIAEATHIEVAPDRGGKEIAGELTKLVAQARDHDAQILYVDFGEAIQQRSHQYLRLYVGDHEAHFTAIALGWPADEAFRSHFASWRERQADWTKGKAGRIEKARARADTLHGEGLALGDIALALDGEGLRSATGKSWTAEMVRKLFGSSKDG